MRGGRSRRALHEVSHAPPTAALNASAPHEPHMPNIPPVAAHLPRQGAIGTGQQPAARRISTAFAGVRSSTTDLKGPYYSAMRNPTLTLNKQARVGDALLACRELSVLWERSFNECDPDDGCSGKPDYRHFLSVERLEAHAPRDIVAITNRRDHAEVQFVDGVDWGRWIAAASRSMEANGRAQRSILVQSPNHVMAMGLRIKATDQGPAYVVKFYDPNRTVTHRRAQAADPDAFAPLGARDFFGDARATSWYSMDANTGSVVFLGDALPDHARQRVEIGHVDSPTLLHLLHLGLAAGVDHYGELLRERRLEPREVAALLAVKTTTGVPLLTVAMKRGHGDAIRAYGGILASAGLDSARVAELLAGKTACGFPGLHVAMQVGTAEGVRAYGDILLASGLSTKARVDLLEAKSRSGMPGLVAALIRNRADAIHAYGEVLFECVPDRWQRSHLLGATEDTAPVMSAALQHARPAARQAYSEVLRIDAIALPERNHP